MLPKAYEPQEVEQKLADKWQNAKLFAAKNDKTKNIRPVSYLDRGFSFLSERS